MTRIAFIGLGNMGGGMAANQAKAGHEVHAFDLSAAAVERAVAAGCQAAGSVAEAVADAEVVITMLPAGPHVRAVYGEQILKSAPKSALLIDSSTIDVESARAVAGQAAEAGFRFADAPVSGGVMAAEAGALAFMVGCAAVDFPAIEAALDPMSRVTIHAGDHGAGQAAKICNNMLLGVSMLGTCEAFALAEKLGLDADRFFEIASKSSGQCWSVTSYCPVPGVGPQTSGRPPLRGRLRLGHDVEGPEAGPGGRRQGWGQHADGGAGRGVVRVVRRQWLRRQGLLGHHPVTARKAGAAWMNRRRRRIRDGVHWRSRCGQSRTSIC